MEENNQNPNLDQPVSPVVQTPTPSVIPDLIRDPSSSENKDSIKTRPKFPILIIGTILFLLIAGSAAGFYIFKQQSLKTAIKPTPSTIAQKLTPSPIPDPTANWKTYTDTTNRYSINYPPNWSANGGCKGADTSEIVYICSQETFGGGTEPIQYYIWIAKEDSINKEYKYTEQSINGITALRTTDAPSRSGAESVYFKDPKANYISVSFTPYDQQKPFPNQDKFHAIFNQILSTFKFTDSAQTPTPDPTTNWKTYSNSVYKYSLKMPIDWVIDTNNAKQNNDALVFITSGDFKVFGDTQVPNLSNGMQLEIKSNFSTEVTKSYDDFITSVRPDKTIYPNDGKQIIIDGEKAILWTSDHAFTIQGQRGYQVGVFHNDQGYLIEMVSALPQDIIFNQILSTFRFD